MTKYIVLIMVLLLPITGLAQSRAAKPVICYEMKDIVSVLTNKENKEIPLWRGGPNENGNNVVLFYNKNTTAWTLVEYRDQTGCVIGMGEQSKFSKELEDKIND